MCREWTADETGSLRTVDERSIDAYRLTTVHGSAGEFWNLQRRPCGKLNFVDLPGLFKTQDEAKQEAEDLIEHFAEQELLRRRETRVKVRHTIHGYVESAIRYGNGIEKLFTEGTAFIKLDAELNRKIPQQVRVKGGWYDEDRDWAVVAFTFPDRFTQRERRLATMIMKHHFPEVYEEATGEIIPGNESMKKRREAFKVETADKWVAISAETAEAGMMAVTASLGGDRRSTDRRVFLVPAEEYRNRPFFGLVIDTESHTEVSAGSSAAPGI